MKEFDVKEELGKLPKKPGVYIMHDADDTILYVGKAKNLHNRVCGLISKGKYRTRTHRLTKWFP